MSPALADTLRDDVRTGSAPVDCGAFVVLPEFTVTGRNTDFATRQVRHFSYTGRLHRVDEGTLAIRDSVAYEGRATRISEFPAGGSADAPTSVQISGIAARAFTDDGRPVPLGTGLLRADFSTDPPSIRSSGIDEPTAVCALLA